MKTVERVIGKFANSFDLKDWESLESVLSENVSVDYSHLRGQRETISRADYVSQRRRALQHLDTHHLLSNAEIDIDGNSASCRISGMIYRAKDDEHFNSHVVYDFQLERAGTSWLIVGIQQTVLWNEGNPDIHPGVKAAGRG